MSGSSENDVFVSYFELPRDGFLEPIKLIDTGIGFSVYKQSHKKGFKSLFRVYMRNAEKNSPDPIKHLFASASFGMESGDGIVISSNVWKRSSYDPIDINSDDFYYNIQSNKFFYKSVEIHAFEILRMLNRWHTKTQKPLMGFWLRFKIFFFHFILASCFKFLFYCVSILQYLLTGQWVKIFDNIKELGNRTGYQPTRLNVTPSKTLKIFEYEVDTWIALIYSLVHIITFLILEYLNVKPQILRIIFGNSFLTLVYVLPTLGFTNAVLPALLKKNKELHPLLQLIQNLYFYAQGSVQIRDLNYRNIATGIIIITLLIYLGWLLM